MGSLHKSDLICFEKLFDMSGGYVLDFSNDSFQMFVIESTGIDIFSGNYEENISKAKRLRKFCSLESDYHIYKLLQDLTEYWHEKKMLDDQVLTDDEIRTYDRCKWVLDKLQGNSIIEPIDKFDNINLLDTKSIQLLVAEIKKSIENNQAELALDRLHTFSTRFFRVICDKHNLYFDKHDALHTLIGKYRSYLENSNLIQSLMTIQIIKTNTNILNNFNTVRNEKSFAHDNDVLNNIESKLICNHIISLLKFIDELEKEIDTSLLSNIF